VQGGNELAIIDLVILGAEHRARELADKVRLASSRLRRRNPSQRQSELLLEGELMEEPRLVVRGQCDDQRPLRPQSHIDAGHLLQFRGESGPAPLALAPERDQRLFAGLGLRAGGQHARGGVARTGTGCALIEHRNRCVPRRQTPGDAETNDSGADDGDVGLARIK